MISNLLSLIKSKIVTIKDLYWWYFSKEAACYRIIWGYGKNRIYPYRKKFLYPMRLWDRLYYELGSNIIYPNETETVKEDGITKINLKHTPKIASKYVPDLLNSGLGVEVGDNSMMKAELF